MKIAETIRDSIFEKEMHFWCRFSLWIKPGPLAGRGRRGVTGRRPRASARVGESIIIKEAEKQQRNCLTFEVIL